MTQKKQRVEEIKEDLRRWYREGYNIEPIYESLRSKDVKTFVSLYKKYKKLIPEMKRYEDVLKNYSDPNAIKYSKMLKDPLKFEEYREDIDSYVRKKQEIEESEDELFDLLTGLKSEEMESGLNPKYTFDNYIVHEGNELAYTAAKKIIEKVGSINPLIIVGESGTGKTHLLNAIGNELVKMNYRVTYENSEEIMLRQKVNFEAQVLLVDDFHLLMEKEEMHPLINLIVENFTAEGKQVIFASNFKLYYYTMEPSLKAKMESGISVELTHPSEAARLEILKTKTKEIDVQISDDVITYLAKNISNTSTLISSLKKIVAFSRIVGKEPSVSMAADLIKSKISLQPGVSYLIEEDKPYRSVSYLRDTIERGYNGIVITRMNPKRFENYFNITADIYWLTDSKTEQKTVQPILENINYFIEKYVDGEYVIYIDGLDFLMSKNSPESVIQFIRHIVDKISETKTILIISLDPKTIEERYLKILERELEIT